MKLKNVAYCQHFPLTIISLQRLEDMGINWTHRSGEIEWFGSYIGHTVRKNGQYVIECDHSEVMKPRQSFFTPKRPAWKDREHPLSWSNGGMWHKRMGHIGPTALNQLAKNTLGVKLKAPMTSQCEDCAMSKITRKPFLQPAQNKATIPFHQISIDAHDLSEGWDGYQGDGRLVRRAIFITCEATGFVVGYFTVTAKEAENLPIIKDAIMWLKLRHGIEVKIIRGDREFCRKETLEWMRLSGIAYEASIPYTHEQNGRAERIGRLIMTKGRAMRLSSRFPHALWKEIISAATYLYNRTPKESLNWQTPYEALFSWLNTRQGMSGPVKPQVHHLRSYGCKCFVLIKSPEDPEYPGRLQKLAPRAHIGFLIGYESTSIYRVWIPHKRAKGCFR